MTPRVHLSRVADDGSNYLDGIRAGLAFAGFGEGLPATPRIFIKPNLTFPSYRAGVMTSPEAVEAAIIALQDFTPNISMGDSDSGGYNRFRMEDVYEATGIQHFAARHNVEVVNLSNLARTTVAFRAHNKDMSVDLPRLLTDDIDALVTMPVPKIHMNTGVSLTFKNQWGCIPEPDDRLHLHPYFKETVVAVNRAVKARYAIIDGRYGLDRSGPMKGDVVPLGWVCVTNDIGAGARVACDLMGVRLEDVAHLRYAKACGLIPELDEIEFNEPLEAYRNRTFHLERVWTDYPGLLAFRSPALAHLAYFSRLARPLHWLLYRFREPFYEYERK